MTRIDDVSFDLLFREARTFSGWEDRAVEPELLEQVYNMMKWGPTSMNASPMRVVFVSSREGKEKLQPCLSSGNVKQTMAAPVTAIFCYDMEFYEQMNVLWPHSDVRGSFEGKPEHTERFVMRSGTLQAAYFMIAARGLGLDCGPMSGFDNAAVDAAFLSGTSWRSNFLCNLGYGDRSKLRPRGARLSFEDVAKIV